MKKLVDTFLDYPWESLLFVIAICTALIGLFIVNSPKQHQGYYISKAISGYIPDYCLMNNWSWWPDDIVFISKDINEVTTVWSTLSHK